MLESLALLKELKMISDFLNILVRRSIHKVSREDRLDRYIDIDLSLGTNQTLNSDHHMKGKVALLDVASKG